MNELQKISGSQGLHLTKTEQGICECLVNFNQLRGFKLDLAEILEWKDSLIRVSMTTGTEVDMDQLQLAIDAMAAGQLEYDDRKGIRNIFIALKFVRRDENGKWKIYKPIY